MDYLPIYLFFLLLFMNFSISCFKEVRRLYITPKKIYLDDHISEQNILSEN